MAKKLTKKATKTLKNMATKTTKVATKGRVITVKNAEGDPDTTATILVQNKINYTPKVSVIIPVYNVEQYLRECLDSVCNQTLKEIEIICVDDGSTDSSLDILKEYAQKDNRITVMAQENLHAGVARNAGLSVAKGKYLHFCDSDDWVEKNIYGECLKKDSDIILFDAFKVDSLLANKISWKKDYLDKSKIKGDINVYEFEKSSASPWGKLFKRDFINKYGIRFQNLICCNDIYFVKLSLLLAQSIDIVDIPLYNWRFNAQGNTSSSRGLHSECIVKFAKQFYKSLVKYALLEKCADSFYLLCTDAFAYEYSQCVFENRTHQMELYKDFLPKTYFSKLIEKITPEFSIIIPVYNAQKTIQKSIDSLLSQTYKNFEIIAVNDGSTDDSLKILNFYKRKDHRIQVIDKPNEGPGIARNTGISVARGKYITFLDADDFCEPNMLEEYSKTLKDTNADIVVSKFHKYSIIENSVTSEGGHFARKELYSINELGEELFTICSPVPWNKVFRKELLIKNEITFPHLKASEDLCFCCNALACAKNVAFINQPFVFWTYDNKNSLHFTSGNKNFECCFLCFIELKKRLEHINAYEKNEKAFMKTFAHTCKWLLNTSNLDSKTTVSAIKKYMQIFDVKKYPYWENFINQSIEQYTQQIIISLTTYPARIGTVNQTIESLLNQTKKADKIILWLAPEQFPNLEKDLPQQLLDLKDKGLTIDWYHDIKSYKKIIPTLQKYPDALIVTADDDLIFEKTWLETLYKGYLKHPNDINIHRATKFYHDKYGWHTIPGGIDFWQDGTPLNKICSGAGAIYPPHCFYKDMLDEKLFLKLAPTNDDQWIWIQAILNNKKIYVVDNNQPKLTYVPGTQETGLCKVNDRGQKLFWKDFNRLMEYYPSAKNILLKEAKKHKVKIPFVVPYKKDLEQWYIRRFGLFDLDNPKTFNEKIQWSKIYDSTPIKTRLADKFLVRDWVAEKIGDKYLIPLLGVYDSFEEIDFDKLPDQFVIKCNHGSAMNIVVKDKSQLNLTDVKSKLDKWMHENFAFKVGCELHYRDIIPKIIIEKYMDDGTGDLRDYKFTCFNGKPEFVWIDSDRHTEHKRNVYDLQWNQMNAKVNTKYDTFPSPEKPKCFDEMVYLAKKLSTGFNYVRVDFYIINDKVYFGEMTFTTSSGTEDIWPASFEKRLYKKFKLPKLAYNIDTGTYYKIPKKQKIYNFKPYLMLPYYLLANMYLKHIKIPVLKFKKHIKSVLYSHSARGRMDIILQSVQSVKDSVQNQINTVKAQQNDLVKQVNNNIASVKQNSEKQISGLSDNIKKVENSVLVINNQISETQELFDSKLAETQKLFESKASETQELFDSKISESNNRLSEIQNEFMADIDTLSEQVDKAYESFGKQSVVFQNQISDNFKVISERLNNSEKLLSDKITNVVDSKYKELSDNITKTAAAQNTDAKRIENAVVDVKNQIQTFEKNSLNSVNDITSKLESNKYELNTNIEKDRILYFNPWSTAVNTERGNCDMTSAPDFENRFKKLIAGLSAESAETVVKIIRRLQLIKGTNSKLDLFTKEEKDLLQRARDFNKEILKVSDNLYAYKNYLLPINHFEASVFLYNHGIEKLNSVENFKDKDILDVGGFIGDSVLMLSPLTNKKIYSFEAMKENFDLMQKTIELNGIKNAVPVHAAVGDKPGEIEIRFNGSASSQNDIMVKDPKYIEKCQVIKMDDYVREHNIDVGLIKVDIEGAEQSFLRGAKETICKYKPTLLISIYHNVDDFLDIKPLIESWNLGYKFKVFKPVIESVSGETLLICEQ